MHPPRSVYQTELLTSHKSNAGALSCACPEACWRSSSSTCALASSGKKSHPALSHRESAKSSRPKAMSIGVRENYPVFARLPLQASCPQHWLIRPSDYRKNRFYLLKTAHNNAFLARFQRINFGKMPRKIPACLTAATSHCTKSKKWPKSVLNYLRPERNSLYTAKQHTS